MPQTSPINWLILSNALIIIILVSKSSMSKNMISIQKFNNKKIFTKMVEWKW